MIASSFIGMRKRYVRSVSIPIFAMSLFLIAIFVASCGDEGDTTEDTPGMTDVLQPTTTPPPTTQPPLPEPPPVSFKDDIQRYSLNAVAIQDATLPQLAEGLISPNTIPSKRAETRVRICRWRR